MTIAVVTVLSAIGICQKSGILCTGGVYTLVSHVFGARIATPVSIVYVLSQVGECPVLGGLVSCLKWMGVWFKWVSVWL